MLPGIPSAIKDCKIELWKILSEVNSLLLYKTLGRDEYCDELQVEALNVEQFGRA
jgi:hypothetical protein